MNANRILMFWMYYIISIFVVVCLAFILNVIRQIKRCRFHQIKTGLSEHLTMG